MTTPITFQARARTIDHLGREQIADCPTAISELWKNSYDAYAQNVSLHIFDDPVKVAAIFDDGHGMSQLEFESKWLTVGTESKTNGFEIPEKDRNGLKTRPKQGQKGIGRLSSAALGPLLLLVSKRNDEKFVAALIDWRLFENPFLYLNDIRIPVTEFEHQYDLVEAIPELFDQMMGNIWGEADDEARNHRINDAWAAFSSQEKNDGLEITTQEQIEQTLIQDVFKEHHLNKWSVWSGDAKHGTAMLIADIQYDLVVLVSRTPLNETDDAEKSTRERFFQTLSNFTDPFSRVGEPLIDDFSYKVVGWSNGVPNLIIGENREFDLKNLEDLEHILDGQVDEDGYFKGRIKVFGEWNDDCIIKPKQVYKTRKDSAFGPFYLRIGTFELIAGSSSLNSSQHAQFMSQAEKYGGLRIYRDGLRVMPYGRPDSDYFSIEERRSRHAGRYFWTGRRLFGRISITREHNPNLKDKAGREGFIENRASKLFREIVEKILIDSAAKYFGTNSENRNILLKSIREQKAQEKAEEDRKKLLSQERKRIRNAIKNNITSLIHYVDDLVELNSTIIGRIKLNSIDELQSLKETIDNYNTTIQSFSLSPVPPNLGRLEDDYRQYRKYELSAKETLKNLTFLINKSISDSTQKTDYEKAQEVYRSKLATINNGITHYAARGKEMINKQQIEFESLIKFCREQYKNTMEDFLEDLKLDKKPLSFVLEKLDEEQERIEIENRQKLSPYITALERINEQIDLENLAIHSMNESIRFRDELSRLHSLAQLGITVEIIGHELEGLDQELSFSLQEIAKESLSEKQNRYYKIANNAHNSLIDRLRFLSPLKLSGEKIITNITGDQISKYISSYFYNKFKDANIVFTTSDSFKKLTLMDIPSRIYPVFINLINNSLYWTQYSESNEKIIKIDFINHEVIISDNGPGVDIDDVDQLFTLFFTRRQKGGRGVGLYLCKQNLQAGGHQIRYETRDSYKVLNGANFVILFKGVDK